MKTALYIQHKKAPLEMQVAEEHEDGTVNLADLVTGEVKVTGCPVTDEPTPGAAVLKLAESDGGGDNGGGEDPVEEFFALLKSGEEVTVEQLTAGLKKDQLEALAAKLEVEASGTKDEIAAAILAD